MSEINAVNVIVINGPDELAQFFADNEGDDEVIDVVKEMVAMGESEVLFHPSIVVRRIGQTKESDAPKKTIITVI
jgi:hypothetical protein